MQSLQQSILREFYQGSDFVIKKFIVHSDPKDGAIESLERLGVAGAGAAATVYFAVDKSGRRFAVRVVDTHEYNVEAHNLFARYTMAPHLFYQVLLKNSKGAKSQVIIMDIIGQPLYKYIRGRVVDIDRLYTAMMCILDKKYLLNVLHGDFHLENIVFLKDGTTLGLIDFDFTLMKVSPIVNILDFIPIMSSLKILRKPAATELMLNLIDYYKDTFNISIDTKGLSSMKIGGYAYTKGNITINSYLAIRALSYPLKDIGKVFPEFTTPNVIK